MHRTDSQGDIMSFISRGDELLVCEPYERLTSLLSNVGWCALKLRRRQPLPE